MIFLDTNSDEIDVNQTYVITSPALLMKTAEVNLEEEEDATDGESDRKWEHLYKIHDERYLLLYKMLRASVNWN